MIKIAAFQADVTPAPGAVLCLGLVKPAKKIAAPLSARGIVFLNNEAPVVLCVVDWVEICNGAHDLWRRLLAEAAGTTDDRVAVHTMHPHDAPGHFFSRDETAGFEAFAGLAQDTDFAEAAARRTADALRAALPQARPATHCAYGRSRVFKVASNRRILDGAGRVAQWRGSSCPDPALRAMPEGVIDPYLRNIILWHADEPVASLTYYASHPQSFYGDGAVSPDFPGLARSIREATLPDTAHLHFSGAGGNVAAGKYNDRAPQNRLILARRLLQGMERAWAAAKNMPLTVADFSWRARPLDLPAGRFVEEKSENELLSEIRDQSKKVTERMFFAAGDLVWKRRRRAGRKILAGCLRLGQCRVLHLPGELFVEYQLAVRNMRGGKKAAVAACGDCGPGYIGTSAAYREGGYETERASRVAPEAESVIMETMRALLAE